MLVGEWVGKHTTPPQKHYAFSRRPVDTGLWPAEVYLRFALGLTAAYLGGGLSAALRQRLQLPEERVKRPPPPAEPPAKRARGAAPPAAPLEDYSQPAANGKKVHPAGWSPLMVHRHSCHRLGWGW